MLVKEDEQNRNFQVWLFQTLLTVSHGSRPPVLFVTSVTCPRRLLLNRLAHSPARILRIIRVWKGRQRTPLAIVKSRKQFRRISFNWCQPRRVYVLPLSKVEANPTPVWSCDKSPDCFTGKWIGSYSSKFVLSKILSTSCSSSIIDTLILTEGL